MSTMKTEQKIILHFLLPLILFKVAGSQELSSELNQVLQCRRDNDCKPNSFCVGNDVDYPGKCKCKSPEYEMQRNKSFYECIPGIPLGATCENHHQCQIMATDLAICNEDNKICECGPDSKEHENKCYNLVEVGDICIHNQSCFLQTNNSFCNKGRCKCPDDLQFSPEASSCIQGKNLGEACTFDAQCTLTNPNTRCDNKCVCKNTYTLSRDGSTCIKATVAFDEPCESDGQCSASLDRSICKEGKCTCSSEYCMDNNACVMKKRIGENCRTNKDCQVGECRESVCKAKQDAGDGNNHSETITIGSVLALMIVIILFK